METKQTKKQKLINTLHTEWKKVFPKEKVFFRVYRGHAPSYSPRYKGKRDYSRPLVIDIKHKMEYTDNIGKFNRFIDLVTEKYPDRNLTYNCWTK